MNENLCRFRPPQKGTLLIWEITNLCNLECAHCCNKSSPFSDISLEVSKEKSISIVNEFEKLNITEVYFTGGEPFFRNDFIDIISHINTDKTVVFVASNGILLTKDKVKKISKVSIKRMTISLDGHTAEIHNKIRRRPFAFEKTVEGISNCIAAGVPVRVSGVITPNNMEFVEEFIELVASLKVKAIVLHTVLPVGRAGQNKELISGKEFNKKIVDKINNAKRKFPDMVIDHSFEDNTSLSDKGCPAGKRLLHITSNGDVSPCSWLYKIDPRKFTLGNIKEMSLKQCLQNNDKVMNPVLKLASNCPISSITK